MIRLVTVSKSIKFYQKKFVIGGMISELVFENSDTKRSLPLEIPSYWLEKIADKFPDIVECYFVGTPRILLKYKKTINIEKEDNYKLTDQGELSSETKDFYYKYMENIVVSHLYNKFNQILQFIEKDLLPGYTEEIKKSVEHGKKTENDDKLYINKILKTGNL